MRYIALITMIVLSASILFADLSEEDFNQYYLKMSIESDLNKKLDGAVKILDEGSDYQKFLILEAAAEASYELGKFVNAKMYANQLLSISNHFQEDWNYGNAIHKGNIILGRVALRQNDIKSANNYLIKAGNTNGSPQLDTFGPNMSLARELLDKGEKETVIEYFELCKRFWEMDNGRLDSWITSIKGGRKPHFGVNLNF